MRKKTPCVNPADRDASRPPLKPPELRQSEARGAKQLRFSTAVGNGILSVNRLHALSNLRKIGFAAEGQSTQISFLWGGLGLACSARVSGLPPTASMPHKIRSIHEVLRRLRARRQQSAQRPPFSGLGSSPGG